MTFSSPFLRPCTWLVGSLPTSWMTSCSSFGLSPQYFSFGVRTAICCPVLMFVFFSCQGPPEMSWGRPSAIGQPVLMEAQFAAGSPLSMTCLGKTGLSEPLNSDFQSAKGGERVTLTVLPSSAPSTAVIWLYPVVLSSVAQPPSAGSEERCSCQLKLKSSAVICSPSLQTASGLMW